MFSLKLGARNYRRSRRYQRVMQDASRGVGLEKLEERALLATVPQLNSLAGAPVEVYLDFDGHVETDAGWRNLNGGNDVITPPYDTDGDRSNLTDAEADEIFAIWSQVAEDYAPFNVNVTTVDPGTYNNFETILVSVGGDGQWFQNGSAGGVAFLNSFSNSASNTAYAFSEVQRTVFNTAMTISHESGHTFGLRHHSQFDANGTKQQEYHPGNGQYGPIMGAPFGNERAIWDNGPANTTVLDLQDDMLTLTRASNRTFKFRTDEHGDNRDNTATRPDFDDNGNISVTSTLETHTDVDVFLVETDDGPISFTASTLDLRSQYGTRTPGANLDVVLRLYDSAGNLLVESRPTDSFSASLNYQATEGSYYVEVASENLYGSAGQYDLDGTIIPLPSIPEMLAPKGEINDAQPRFSWTKTAATLSYELQVNNLTTGQTDVIREAGLTNPFFVPVDALPEGDYEARVRSVSLQGQVSGWSEFLGFTIDVLPPGVPKTIAPRGRVEESRPEFSWEAAVRADTYNLEVVDTATGDTVIFRNSISGTAYRHFLPLPDGNYDWKVTAVNQVGEKGLPSDVRNFTIVNPKAGVPVILTPDAGRTSKLRPKITWTPVINAEGYELRVHNRSTGENNVIREKNLTKTEYVPPARMDQGTYRADVRAFNAVGEFTEWSEVVVFRIDVPLPTTPTLTGPSGDPVETQKPTFTWTKARRAQKYQLRVLDAARDDVEVLSVTINSGKVLQYLSRKKLPESTELRAVIWAENVVGEVSPTDELTFSIDVPAPARPIVTGPRRNTNGTVADTTPTFSWTAVANASSYDLKVVNRRTGKAVIRQKSVKTASFTPTEPLAEEPQGYDVTVRARNTAGDLSAFSKKYTFILDVPTPETPTMFGPTGNITAQRPTADWEHVDAADRYQLFVKQLSTDSTKSYNVRNFDLNADESIASFRIPDRLARGTYQIWVRAVNSANEMSGFSNSVTFTIVSSEIAPADLPADTGTQQADPVATPAPTTSPVDAAAETIVLVERTAVETVRTQDQATDLLDHQVLTAAIAGFGREEWSQPADEPAAAVGTDALSEVESTESPAAARFAMAGMALPVIAGRLMQRFRDRRRK